MKENLLEIENLLTKIRKFCNFNSSQFEFNFTSTTNKYNNEIEKSCKGCVKVVCYFYYIQYIFQGNVYKKYRVNFTFKDIVKKNIKYTSPGYCRFALKKPI